MTSLSTGGQKKLCFLVKEQHLANKVKISNVILHDILYSDNK